MGIEKHIKITGSSTISWKDAIVKSIEDISKSISNLSSVKIIDQRAIINGDKMTLYYVDLDITFRVNSNKI